jgi:hypothetical protein
VQASHLEGVAGDTRAQGSPEVDLVGDLGLDVIGKPVAVVAGEVLATRHGGEGDSGPHLLDVVVIAGVDNGRDIEVGQAVPAAELNLAEHAGLVLRAGLDSVPVADPSVGERDSGVLGTADGNAGERGRLRIGSEDKGALDVVEGPESNRGGAGDSGRGNKGHERSRELHVCGVVYKIAEELVLRRWCICNKEC